MLKKIIFHETLLNLTSFRFQLIVGLFVVMFFGGLYVSVDAYKTRLREYNEIAAADEATRIAIPPNPLGAFAEGMAQYSSMAVTFDNAEIKVKDLGKNNVISVRFSVFESPDFSFAVKVLLSLGAILVTFASVSGERFAGTLKLVSASGVSKKHLILAKLLASFVCLAVPLLVCTIISCVILAINDMLIASMDILRVSLFVIFSLVYILFFLLIGLIISISTKRPQESLVTGVLFWLLIVFILPALTPQAANLFADLPSARAMEEARSQRFIGGLFDLENALTNDSWDDVIAQYNTENDSAWEVARNQLANYARIKRGFDLLSPADIYNNAGMEIVGNGAENAFQAKRAVLRHKDMLREAQTANAKFSFQRLGFISDLMPALISMFVLCLEICVLLVFAYRKFMALDMREG